MPFVKIPADPTATKERLDVKDSVRAATTANITLSGLQTVDGVVLAEGDRALVKDQTTGSQNGIYTASANAWVRTTDADESGKLTPQMTVFVEEGTSFARVAFVLTNQGAITLGTTALTFATAGGGALADLLQVDNVTPTPGQTAFTLSKLPKNAASVEMGVDGADYILNTDFTVLGQTVTWAGPFTLDATDRVTFRYT